MKTLKLTFIAIALFIGINTFAQKGTKIGVINSNELLAAMPEKNQVQKELENYAKELESAFMTMQKEYETKLAEYQANQASYSDIIKKTKIKELTDLEQRIQAFQQSAQEDLQNKESELLQPIIDKAKKAIEDVAKEHGYTLVLDSGVGVVLYSVEGDDILPLVLKKLGISSATGK
jgi:outer membrane protein